MESDDDPSITWTKKPIKNKNKIKHMLYLQLPKSTLYFLFLAFFAWLVILYGLTYEKPLESGKESQITLFKEQLKQENDPITDDSAHNATKTLDNVLLSTCAGNSECAKDLKALCTLETNCNPERIGDGGKSYGLYQIHRGYHPDITIEQAKDIEWSTQWTLNRLKYYGYDDSARRDYAIMKHNGTPGTPKTLAYLAKFKKIRASL